MTAVTDSVVGDVTAGAWWKIYADLLPAHQSRVDLDDVCEAAGVAPDQIMAVVVSTAIRMGQDVGDLVAAAAHPSIVRASVKSARRLGGKYAGVALKDREMLYQHHKFVPVPRGTTVQVNAHASAHAAAVAANQPTVPTFADSLRGADEAQREVQTKLLVDAVDAEVVTASGGD